MPAELIVLLGRDIDADDAIDPGARGLGGKPVRPAPKHRVGISHQDERDFGMTRAEAGGDGENVVGRRAGSQATQVSRLDRRPIRHRVGKRHPELDNVCAPCDEGVEDGGRRTVARGHEGNEGGMGTRERGCESSHLIEMSKPRIAVATATIPEVKTPIRTVCFASAASS